MIINGKEVRVLLEALLFYEYIYLDSVINEELSEDEEIVFQELKNKLRVKVENEYKQFENQGEILTDKRLSIIISVDFSDKDIDLIQEALSICIHESEKRKDDSINDYGSGHQYNLTLNDYIELYSRFK